MNDDTSNIPIRLAPAADPLHRFILETFATAGRSPTLEEIRGRFSLATLSEADAMVTALVRSGAVHRNEGDPAITHAYPFSNEPTVHRVQLADGPEVYAMCAVDALGMPFMLRRDADVVSACGQCAADVRVEVRDGRVQKYSPAETVVWLGHMDEGCVAAVDLCPDLNFFCSADHAGEWARAHPDKSGQQLSFEEALTRGRQVFEGLLYRGGDCCSS